MNVPRRRLLVAPPVLLCSSVVGCLDREQNELGPVLIRNDSEFPQLVHVEPAQYPSTVPEPEQRLSTSVYVEPDESKYYENLVEFTGRYEFTATLENDDVQTTTSELQFSEGEDGTVSGYAIAFTVQAGGGLSWSVTPRDGTFE